jgi:hypothetical protein
MHRGCGPAQRRVRRRARHRTRGLLLVPAPAIYRDVETTRLVYWAAGETEALSNANSMFDRSTLHSRRYTSLPMSVSRWHKFPHPRSEDLTRERGFVDPLAYRRPRKQRDVSLGRISNRMQRLIAETEAVAEGPSSHAGGSGLQRGYRVNNLTHNIRRQVPEDLRHHCLIDARPASYNQLTLLLPNPQGPGLFNCRAFCLAGFGICLIGSGPLLQTVGLRTSAFSWSQIGKRRRSV